MTTDSAPLLYLVEEESAQVRYPVENDGTRFIAVHSAARTELGRLLHITAQTPFSFAGLENVSMEGGEWPCFLDLAKRLAPGWVEKGHAPTKGVSEDLVKAMRCKLDQNWYLRDMFLESYPKPLIFVSEMIVEDEASKGRCYVGLSNHGWLENYLVKYRRKLVEELERRAKSLSKKKK